MTSRDEFPRDLWRDIEAEAARLSELAAKAGMQQPVRDEHDVDRLPQMRHGTDELTPDERDELAWSIHDDVRRVVAAMEAGDREAAQAHSRRINPTELLWALEHFLSQYQNDD